MAMVAGMATAVSEVKDFRHMQLLMAVKAVSAVATTVVLWLSSATARFTLRWRRSPRWRRRLHYCERCCWGGCPWRKGTAATLM